MSAFEKQIGGSHYASMVIQPAEYCHLNGIGKLEGDVIAYVSRWKTKNGLEDLRKARHTLDLVIEMEEEKLSPIPYVPVEDIDITMTGQDIRPQVNFGEPCQIEDDLHWDEHHEARMDVIGQNGFAHDVFMGHEDEEAMGR